jgi:hypothetical protein
VRKKVCIFLFFFCTSHCKEKHSCQHLVIVKIRIKIKQLLEDSISARYIW